MVFFGIVGALLAIFGLLCLVTLVAEWFSDVNKNGIEPSPYTRRTLKVLSTPTLFSIAKKLRSSVESDIVYIERNGPSTATMVRMRNTERDLSKVEKELRRRGSETP